MTKISELSSATAVAAEDTVPVVQSGVTKQAPFSVLAAFLGGASGAVNSVLSSLVTRKRPYLMTGFTAGADNSAAFNNAVLAASPYDSLLVPKGSWTHSTQLNVPVGKPKLFIGSEGGMGELIGTNPLLAGMRVYADDTTVAGLRHTVPGTSGRNGGKNEDDCPFSAWNCSRVVFRDLHSTGGRDAGFFIFGVKGMEAHNLISTDSRADGWHVTYGTTDVLARNITSIRPGDDGIAVVSYGNDPALCERIRVEGYHVVDGNARGASVVGGNDVTYIDGDVARCRSAGVYVGNESNADTGNTKNTTKVRVHRVRLLDPNWGTDDHGAVILVNQLAGTTVSDVEITGVTAGPMRKTSYGQTYSAIKTAGGRLTGILFSDWVLAAGKRPDGTPEYGYVYIDGGYTPRAVLLGQNTAYTYQAMVASTSLGSYDLAGPPNGAVEGSLVYGVAGSAGTSTSTAAAPDFILRRIALR